MFWIIKHHTFKKLFAFLNGDVIFSRTLTAVYDAILADLVYPVDIVGKRIRVKSDGKQLIKVHLDKTQQPNYEHKVRL